MRTLERRGEAMKNWLLGPFQRPLQTPPSRPVETCPKATVQAIMAETRREAAMFAADLMGVQSHFGQFDKGSRYPARIDSSRFRDLIEGIGDAFMIIDPRPGLHIVDINDSYAAATLTRRDRIVSKKLFDVFPDNPDTPDADGVSNLYESILRAAQSGLPHAMTAQRYDVRDDRGNFVASRWHSINTPIFDERGQLMFVLHQANKLPVS